MAFCKFCGKQIPEGGTCDCAESKTAAEATEKVENAAETVKEEAAQAVENVKDKAADAAEAVKDKAEEAVNSAEKVVNEVRSDAADAAKEVQQKAEGGFKQLNGSDIAKKVEGLADKLAEYGADRVILVDDPALKDYRTEPYTHALASVINEYKIGRAHV